MNLAKGMDQEIVKQDVMHGSIFILLKRFIESQKGPTTWENILHTAGVGEASYQMHGMYPTDDLFAIVHQISENTGISVYDLMEQFGEFIVPDLIFMYREYLIPEWQTYEMLLYTEEKMHGAVRKQDKRTDPPRLLVTKKGNNRLVIDYSSKRRLSGIAVGIIRGIAKYYKEDDQVVVTRLSKPDAEVVQILVDFKNRDINT